VATVEFLLRNKRAYVLSDLGTGKTLCPLWAYDILHQLGKVKRMLVVSPLSTVRFVWAAEIFNNFPHIKHGVAHGNYASRVSVIHSTAQIVIINFDGVKSCEEELIKAEFDIVVIDELTAYKNFNNDRSKAMHRLLAKGKPKAVWGMTGAPTPNSPSEAFGQAKVVNPDNPFLPRYFTKFKAMVETEVAPYVWVPKHDAKQTVFKVLQPAIRFEMDKCIDLPPCTYQDVPIGLSKEQAEVYESVKKELYYEYDEGEITAVNAAVKLSKLLQVSAGSVKDSNGCVLHLDISPKIDDIMETFYELGKTKLIIVSAFRASVERLCDIFKGEKFRSEFIHSDVSLTERTRIMDSFQNGNLQFLTIQPQTISHGVTLTACNTMIWQSYVASGETYNQVNGRIRRAGQTRKQFIRRQVSSQAEKHLVNLLDGKMDGSKEILKMFTDHLI